MLRHATSSQQSRQQKKPAQFIIAVGLDAVIAVIASASLSGGSFNPRAFARRRRTETTPPFCRTDHACRSQSSAPSPVPPAPTFQRWLPTSHGTGQTPVQPLRADGDEDDAIDAAPPIFHQKQNSQPPPDSAALPPQPPRRRRHPSTSP
jgi:hypothetical protein